MQVWERLSGKLEELNTKGEGKRDERGNDKQEAENADTDYQL